MVTYNALNIELDGGKYCKNLHKNGLTCNITIKQTDVKVKHSNCARKLIQSILPTEDTHRERLYMKKIGVNVEKYLNSHFFTVFYTFFESKCMIPCLNTRT